MTKLHATDRDITLLVFYAKPRPRAGDHTPTKGTNQMKNLTQADVVRQIVDEAGGR